MGSGYVYLSGGSGDYISTPDFAAFPTGDISVEFDIALDEWATKASYLLSKWGTSGNRTMYIRRFSHATFFNAGPYLSDDGVSETDIFNNYATPTVSDGERMVVRFDIDLDDGAGDSSSKMYYDNVLKSTDTNTGTVSDIHDGNAEIQFFASGGANLEAGYLYHIKIWDTLSGGDPVFHADFSSLTQPEIDDGYFTCDTGQVITINGTGWTAVAGDTTVNPPFLRRRLTTVRM